MCYGEHQKRINFCKMWPWPSQLF